MSAKIRKLIKAIEPMIINEIITKIKQVQLKSPAYCLFVWYHDMWQCDFTPQFGLATKSLRDFCLTVKNENEVGGDRFDAIWRPQQCIDRNHAEAPQIFDLESVRELSNQCYVLLQEDENLKDEEEALTPFKEMIFRVVKNLNLYQFKTMIPVTDDFIVIASDYIGEWIVDDMNKSTPKDKIERLRALGYWDGNTIILITKEEKESLSTGEQITEASELRAKFNKALKSTFFYVKPTLNDLEINHWINYLCGIDQVFPESMSSDFHNPNNIALTKTIISIFNSIPEKAKRNFIKYLVISKNNPAIHEYTIEKRELISSEFISEIIKSSGGDILAETPKIFGEKFIINSINQSSLDFMAENKIIGEISSLCDKSMKYLYEKYPDQFYEAIIKNKTTNHPWPWSQNGSISDKNNFISARFIGDLFLSENADHRYKELANEVITNLRCCEDFYNEIIKNFENYDDSKKLYDALKFVVTSGAIFRLSDLEWQYKYRFNPYLKFLSSFTIHELMEGVQAGSKIPGAKPNNILIFMQHIKFKVGKSRDVNDLLDEWLNRPKNVVATSTHNKGYDSPKIVKDEQINEQLRSNNSTERALAVSAISKSMNPSWRTRLASMLYTEKSEDVRLELYKALDPLWINEGRVFSRTCMAQRMSEVRKRLAKPVAPWLDEAALPPLPLKNGAIMSTEEVRHLCSSLAIMPDLQVHPEVRPWFDLINDDRKATGPFALALLKAYLSSKIEPKFRFVLGLAGRLGDEDILPILQIHANTVAKGSRGKMAEYAATAIALQGSNSTLPISPSSAQFV